MSINHALAAEAGLKWDDEKIVDTLCSVPAIQALCDFADETVDKLIAAKDRIAELEARLKDARRLKEADHE